MGGAAWPGHRPGPHCVTPLPNQNFHAQKASSLYGHSRHLDCSALLVRCRRGAIGIHERDGSEQGDSTPPVTLNPSHPFPLLRPPTAGTQARTGDKLLVLHSSHANTPSVEEDETPAETRTRNTACRKMHVPENSATPWPPPDRGTGDRGPWRISAFCAPIRSRQSKKTCEDETRW